MVVVNKKTQDAIKSILVALAIAGLLWAVIALFFPIKTSYLKGTLDSGRQYSTVFKTYAYNSLNGLILLLIGLIDVLVSIMLLRGKYEPLKAVFWSLYSGVLALSTVWVGMTPVISWLPNIPPEVQHAIGSEYATLTEQTVMNIPALICYVFIAIYFGGALLLWTLERKK